jgi:hypothetical protein
MEPTGWAAAPVNCPELFTRSARIYRYILIGEEVCRLLMHRLPTQGL